MARFGEDNRPPRERVKAPRGNYALASFETKDSLEVIANSFLTYVREATNRKYELVNDDTAFEIRSERYDEFGNPYRKESYLIKKDNRRVRIIDENNRPRKEVLQKFLSSMNKEGSGIEIGKTNNKSKKEVAEPLEDKIIKTSYTPQLQADSTEEMVRTLYKLIKGELIDSDKVKQKVTEFYTAHPDTDTYRMIQLQSNRMTSFQSHKMTSEDIHPLSINDAQQIQEMYTDFAFDVEQNLFEATELIDERWSHTYDGVDFEERLQNYREKLGPNADIAIQQKLKDEYDTNDVNRQGNTILEFFTGITKHLDNPYKPPKEKGPEYSPEIKEVADVHVDEAVNLIIKYYSGLDYMGEPTRFNKLLATEIELIGDDAKSLILETLERKMNNAPKLQGMSRKYNVVEYGKKTYERIKKY